MKLENEFTVPVDVDTVYRALNDPEKVTPCFAGVVLHSYEGDDFAGTVTVKLGPISMTYEGTGTFVERDAVDHRLVVDASGRDSRSNGTASARATLTMVEAGGGTTVTVRTEMQVTGKPAQFGRGVMSDVCDEVLGRFAACLAEELAGDAPAAAPATPSGGAPAAASGAPAAPPVSAPPAPAPVAGGSGAPEPVPTATTAAPAAAAATATPATATPAAATPAAATPTASTPAASAPTASNGTAPAQPRPQHQRVEEVDLLESSRESVLRRLAPVGAGVGVLAVILAIVWFARRR